MIRNKKFLPVYIDGIEITEEIYPVIFIRRNYAVIIDPDMMQPNNYDRIITTHPQKYFAAKIEFNIDDNLQYSCIEKISVCDPLKRGQHMGRALIFHVLRQLKDNQQIWVNPSADPTPVDRNCPDGPCYGLRQRELEIYYKRFSYGKYRRQILFKKEIKK